MNPWDDAWKTENGRKYWLESAPLVVSLLPRFQQEGIVKILDLGFGVGRHAILLAKQGFEVFGAELSPTGAQYAQQWSQQEKVSLHLTCGEMDQLPFIAGAFDLILAWNVIYHGRLEEIHNTVREIERCLRPQGFLLCTLISTRHHKYGLGKKIEPNTFIIKKDQEKSIPHHYFDKEEIELYFKKFDFDICDEVEQATSESYHWQILARCGSK